MTREQLENITGAKISVKKGWFNIILLAFEELQKLGIGIRQVEHNLERDRIKFILYFDKDISVLDKTEKAILLESAREIKQRAVQHAATICELCGKPKIKYGRFCDCIPQSLSNLCSTAALNEYGPMSMEHIWETHFSDYYGDWFCIRCGEKYRASTGQTGQLK